MISINLSNKKALVTGGAAGIGKGCVEVLAQAGAEVIIADKNRAAAASLSSALNDIGYKTRTVYVDMADAGSITAMCHLLATDFGTIDVLVNNAGFNLFKGLEDTSEEEWDAIMDVDLKGVFLLTKAALPLLKASGAASIVNISSNHTRSTIPDIFAYATAKSGLSGMANSLCQELGKYGIRVNTVSPGFTATPLLERWLQSTGKAEEARHTVDSYHPLGKIGTPENIGHAVAFLSSSLASNITGANLFIDGGLSLRLMH
jgi:NAD(P)-dependent dehydrogenase (short-subunit alcohol dehydrogenase family)